MVIPELSPCMSCGTHPDIVDTGGASVVTWTRVFCPKCQVGAGDWDRDEALRRWEVIHKHKSP